MSRPTEEEQAVLTALRRVMATEGVSVSEVERRMGVERGWWSSLVAGRRVLRHSQILDVLRELGVAPGDFFGDLYPATDPLSKPVTVAEVEEVVRQILLEEHSLGSKSGTESRGGG